MASLPGHFHDSGVRVLQCSSWPSGPGQVSKHILSFSCYLKFLMVEKWPELVAEGHRDPV